MAAGQHAELRIASEGHPSVLDQLRLAIPGVVRSVGADQCIAIEGAANDAVIGVMSGLVRCFRMTPDGRRHICRFVGPGGLVGLGVLGANRHSVETVSQAQIVFFPATAIKAGADKNPAIRTAIFDALAEELDERDRAQLRLGRLSADERVADFLLELFDERGRNAASSNLIPMTRADMADHLGVTLETVSRAMHRFQRMGLIRLTNVRNFLVTRPALLRRIAAGDAGIAERRPRSALAMASAPHQAALM